MELSLADFFEEMDQLSEPPSLKSLLERIKRLSISFKEISPAVHFSAERYQRNLLHQGPHYLALILCWANGQRSPIHDHRGSACGVRVIQGTATETLFERTPSGYIRAVSSRELFEGQVCGSFDNDIHQVSNLQDGNAKLITLHVYTPPLLNMRTYRMEDNHVSEFIDPVLEVDFGAYI